MTSQDAKISNLEAENEDLREALRVIAAGSGYEWSDTREQLHRIIDANVECAQNALAAREVKP
jgi:hypothetical protein